MSENEKQCLHAGAWVVVVDVDVEVVAVVSTPPSTGPIAVQTDISRTAAQVRIESHINSTQLTPRLRTGYRGEIESRSATLLFLRWLLITKLTTYWLPTIYYYLLNYWLSISLNITVSIAQLAILQINMKITANYRTELFLYFYITLYILRHREWYSVLINPVLDITDKVRELTR